MDKSDEQNCQAYDEFSYSSQSHSKSPWTGTLREVSQTQKHTNVGDHETKHDFVCYLNIVGYVCTPLIYAI